MADRYAKPTWDEYAQMARESETLDLSGCSHAGACLRLLAMLSDEFDEDELGGYGAKAQAARERAASFMECNDCDQYEEE